MPKKSSYKIGEEIECSANGNPAPEITWSVGDQEAEMKHDAGWKIITVPEAWSQSEHTLTCTASNEINGISSELLESDITFTVSGKK